MQKRMQFLSSHSTSFSEENSSLFAQEEDHISPVFRVKKTSCKSLHILLSIETKFDRYFAEKPSYSCTHVLNTFSEVSRSFNIKLSTSREKENHR